MLVLALLTGGLAFASPADHFGFGAVTVGRAGGGWALDGDSSAALGNPALLAGLESSELQLGFSVTRFSFSELPPIYWDTNQDGLINEADTPLDMNGGYDRADGTSIGVARRIGDRAVLGLSVFGPQDRLLRLYTIEPELPTYFMYRNRAHRYAMAMALAVAPTRDLELGAGVQVISRSVLKATLTVDAVVEGTPSQGGAVSDVATATVDVHSIYFDLIPKAIPVLGARWKVGERIPALDGLAVAGSWHGTGGIPVEFLLDAQVNARAQDVGELEPVSAAILAEAGIQIYDHYIPNQFQVGIAYSLDNGLSLFGDLIHTRWAALQLNVTRVLDSEVQATLADVSDLKLQDGNDVSGVMFRNTTSARAGLEYHREGVRLPQRFGPGQLTGRFGVGFEPSPLLSQTAETALLDSDRLIFGAGVSLSHGPIWAPLGDGDMGWNLSVQSHRLIDGALTRRTPDGPTAGYAVDGAPLPIGGGFFTAGLSWSLDY